MRILNLLMLTALATAFIPSGGWAADLCSDIFLRPTIVVHRASSQAEDEAHRLKEIYKTDNKTGVEIHDRLSVDPELKALLDADAGVREGYTIRAHNLLVQDVYEELLPQFQRLPVFQPGSPIRGAMLMRWTIALHDIGKPLAIAQGNKEDQHVYTLPILSRELAKAGFTTDEIRLAEALVDNDVFGDLLRGKKTVAQAIAGLRQLAQHAHMDLKSFADLQALFYTMDAASYPKLRALFFGYDQAGQFIPTNQLYENLMAQLADQAPRNHFEALRDVVPQQFSQAWAPEHFTDPRQHNPDDYRYLIHGSNTAELYDHFLPRGQVDSFSQISLSVIDQKHSNTFSPVGLILSAPAENFFAAAPTDMLSSTILKVRNSHAAISYLDTLPALYKKYGLPSPEEILAKTQSKPAFNAFGHNEVIATSLGLHGASLQIKALFFAVDSLGHPLAATALLQHVTELAAKYSLPMVPIGPGKGAVTVRVKVEQDPLNPDNKVTKVLASPAEFHRLQAQAAQSGLNLVGIGDGHTLVAGVFYQDKFIQHGNIDSPADKLAATHFSMVYPLQFTEP